MTCPLAEKLGFPAHSRSEGVNSHGRAALDTAIKRLKNFDGPASDEGGSRVFWPRSLAHVNEEIYRRCTPVLTTPGLERRARVPAVERGKLHSLRFEIHG